MKKILQLFLVIPLFCHSQDAKIDSLKNVLKSAKDDTGKVSTLNRLAWELSSFNNDSAIYIANEQMKLAEKINWQLGVGKTHNSIGYFYDLIGKDSIAF